MFESMIKVLIAPRMAQLKMYLLKAAWFSIPVHLHYAKYITATGFKSAKIYSIFHSFPMSSYWAQSSVPTMQKLLNSDIMSKHVSCKQRTVHTLVPNL